MTATLHRPRLETLAAHLLANRDQHNQVEYAMRGNDCGTWYCAAGWTVILAGYNLEWASVDAADIEDSWPEGVDQIAGMAYEPHLGRYVNIDDEAAELLGLTPDQAATLFHNFGDTDEIVAVINGFLNEAS